MLLNYNKVNNMAQTQKTIRFNTLSDKLISQVKKNGEVNYNYATNQLIRRYNALCDYITPDFSEAEWYELHKLSHELGADVVLEAKAFRWNVSEHVKDKDLVFKCEELTIPEIIAVFNHIERMG